MTNQENSITPELNRLLGLHQEIHIFYAVDCYQAIFYSDDSCINRLAEGKGETVLEAIMSLESELAKLK